MPTGYTSDIAKGITFEQYALNCARAFGACVEMRDEASDAPIPDEFKASNYHSEKLTEANKQLAEVKKMTVAQCAKAVKIGREEHIKRYNKQVDEAHSLLQKYQDMLEKVESFAPPSIEHIEYKTFLATQIQDSIKWDCNIEHFTKPTDTLLKPEEWRKKQIAKCLSDIEYHAKEQKAENDRAAKRTLWIKQLRAAIQEVKE